MSTILIQQWRPGAGKINLGDFAGEFIVRALGYETLCVANATPEEIAGYDEILIPIGTYFGRGRLDQMPHRKIYWGCGYGAEIGYKIGGRTDVEVRALRGPESAFHLGIQVPLGDTALLLPKYLPLEKTGDGGVLHVPHHLARAHVTEEFLDRFEIDGELDPILDSEADFIPAVQKIRNAAFVITSSLHGAILAQAYGIPWAFAWPRNAPRQFLLKYEDWCAYLGVPFQVVTSYAGATEWWAAHGSRGRVSDLEPLLNSFPHP